jgi:glycine dehydrogenase subunit 1
MGPQGMREVAELCLQKSHYAARELCSADRLSPAFDRPFFKEFVLRDQEGQVEQLLADANSNGFFAGVPLGRWYPELSDCLLVTVTEKRTKAEIDRLATCMTRTSNRPAAVHA